MDAVRADVSSFQQPTEIHFCLNICKNRSIIVGRKLGATSYTVVLLVGEYPANRGKDAGVGNGYAKGSENVAPLFAAPAFNRN